jgi:hypothetical protein
VVEDVAGDVQLRRFDVGQHSGSILRHRRGTLPEAQTILGEDYHDALSSSNGAGRGPCHVRYGVLSVSSGDPELRRSKHA